ncbi:hypothetical protein [Aeromonas popoffii]|uniref:hypothetical protein n=1 Tax=Aeromonas popoffii TaxID=70856 RepID=UPI0005AB256C|nr:hypothetical protein [Aeromonas popoffii]
MTDADANDFDESAMPPEVRGVHADGEGIEQLMNHLRIENGDAVVLRHQGNDVYIQNVVLLGSGIFRGSLKTNYFHEYFTLPAGRDFTFQDKHAFRVNRHIV